MESKQKKSFILFGKVGLDNILIFYSNKEFIKKIRLTFRLFILKKKLF